MWHRQAACLLGKDNVCLHFFKRTPWYNACVRQTAQHTLHNIFLPKSSINTVMCAQINIRMSRTRWFYPRPKRYLILYFDDFSLISSMPQDLELSNITGLDTAIRHVYTLNVGHWLEDCQSEDELSYCTFCASKKVVYVSCVSIRNVCWIFNMDSCMNHWSITRFIFSFDSVVKKKSRWLLRALIFG